MTTHHDVAYPDEVSTEGGIVNSHTHPRDPEKEGDGRTELFMPYYDGVYVDVVCIGNTKMALTTPQLALKRKRLWQRHTSARVHVAGLMTEATTPEMIIKAYDQPDDRQAMLAMKMFLRAVSNSGGHDVDDIKTIIPCVKAMANTKWKHRKKPMVLKIHCERKFTPLGRTIQVSDRERIAVERDIEIILKEVPEAVIEICHVSDGATIDAIRYYQSKGYQVHGEISPHYTEYTIDDLFEDGKGGTALNSHVFCLPIFKSQKDRTIILFAMTSGEPWFHFGNDEACHDHDVTKGQGVKINNRGTALGGQTQIPEAIISYVIEKFVEADRLDKLSGFLCHNARRLYGLESRTNVVTKFRRNDWEVPGMISRKLRTKTINCAVAMGGQTRKYQVERTLA